LLTLLMAGSCVCWKIGPIIFREFAFITQAGETSPRGCERSLISFARSAFSLNNRFVRFENIGHAKWRILSYASVFIFLCALGIDRLLIMLAPSPIALEIASKIRMLSLNPALCAASLAKTFLSESHPRELIGRLCESIK